MLAGILAAFSEPVAHGWANVLDHYFSTSVYKRLTPFMFWSAVFGLPFTPLVWLFGAPALPGYVAFGLIFVAAIGEVAYQYPYFWALKEVDTSVVASLFGLGRVILPVLAFFVVGEQLTPAQYAGFFLIVFSSIFLTADLRRVRINKAFFFMLASSLIGTAQTVLVKYIFEMGVSWSSFVTWLSTCELAILAALMLLPKNRPALWTIRRDLRGRWGLFFQQRVFSWVGNVGSYLAIALIPVTISKAIASTQPIFPLVYAGLFARRWPELFREQLARGDVTKKVLLFVCIVLGTILTVAG